MTDKLDTKFLHRLDNELNGTILYEVLFIPMRNFLIKDINKNWDGMNTIDLLGDAIKNNRPSKPVALKACAFFYANEKALKAFYQSLEEADKKLIEKATWEQFVGYEELNTMFGIPVFKGEKKYQYYSDLIIDPPLKKWSCCIRSSQVWSAPDEKEYLRRSNPTLTFPVLLKEIYSKILTKPEGYYLEPVELPVEESLVIFNAEADIFRELPLITTYYIQANIRYTQKGYPNAASARKMSKSLQLKIFPEEGESGLRAMLIAGLFSDDFSVSGDFTSSLAILQKLFERDFSRHVPAPYILAHLKGINNIDRGDFHSHVTEKIFEIIKQISSEGWVTFENLHQYVSSHFIEIQPFYSFYDIQRLKVKDYVGGETYISTDFIYQYITSPYLAGHLYLLAAFGLLELAINPDMPPIFTHYDGLCAFRRTALGDFLLGLKTEYSIPEFSDETKLLFDENSPIIRIEGNIAIGDAILRNYAEKVSENRYQLNPGKFLKDCSSEKDLKNKIAFFKQTIQQELPTFWETYLEQFVENCKAIDAKKKMNVFSLPPRDTNLHRLIAQDNILRSIIIKAEKFHILVEQKDMPLFLNRMKEMGYLI